MQTIRPDSDITRTANLLGGQIRYVTGATANAILSATQPISGTFIESVARSFGDVVVVGLGNPGTTPANDYNHFLSFWAGKSAAGKPVKVLCQLRQGYTSETSQGTLIAALDAQPSTTVTKYNKRLTLAEAALITDYTDLQLRFVMATLRTQDSDLSNTPVSLDLLQAQVDLPDSDQGAKHILLNESEMAARLRGVEPS